MVKSWIMDHITDFLTALWQFIYGTSYWIALFVGLAAILLYICGHKKSLKWVWTSVLAYTILSALGGL